MAKKGKVINEQGDILYKNGAGGLVRKNPMWKKKNKK